MTVMGPGSQPEGEQTPLAKELMEMEPQDILDLMLAETLAEELELPSRRLTKAQIQDMTNPLTGVGKLRKSLKKP